LPSIRPPLTQISFRCFKSISVSKFLATFLILNSRLITHPPPNLSDLVDAYNSTLASLIDIHALSKPKLSKLNLSTSILLPYLPSKQPVVTWKTFGFALAHLITSNFFALPLTNITPLLLLRRNASTPLILLPPLQNLANFGIPSTLSSSVNLLLFFLH